MIDHKRIAGERGRQLRRMRRRIRLLGAGLRDDLKRELSIAIHAKGLLSLSDERVVQLIDEIAGHVARKINGRLLEEP